MLLSPNDRMCPIGLAADLIGDKWSIIILRDIALFNRQTYNVLLRKNLEGISSSTLAKKLNRLLDIKLLNVRKDKSHSQKKIYCLTEAAIAFMPIIFNLAHWADEYDQPSELFIKPIENYLNGDKDLIDTFLDGLRKIHLEQIPISDVDLIFQELAMIQ